MLECYGSKRFLSVEWHYCIAACCIFHTVIAYAARKILELEEELKVVGNAMKSLEIFEQEVSVA